MRSYWGTINTAQHCQYAKQGVPHPQILNRLLVNLILEGVLYGDRLSKAAWLREPHDAIVRHRRYSVKHGASYPQNPDKLIESSSQKVTCTGCLSSASFRQLSDSSAACLTRQVIPTIRNVVIGLTVHQFISSYLCAFLLLLLAASRRFI